MSKKRDDSYFAAGRRRRKKYMMIIVPIIIAVAAAGAAGAILYQPEQVMAVSGVECHRTEQTTYHVHSHLDVFVDGEKQQVPAKVGILSSPSCLFWLHTHDTDGIIHVEAPQTKAFTLGQFLNIWNQTNDSNGLFDSVSGKNVTAYVNGDPFQGNYRDIQLESRKQIVLAYGQPPAKIPEYDFGNLR
ncbi:MAG TPA: hypothetical protein VGJ42_03155 [Nitrososphaera sp.]